MLTMVVWKWILLRHQHKQKNSVTSNEIQNIPFIIHACKKYIYYKYVLNIICYDLDIIMIFTNLHDLCMYLEMCLNNYIPVH